MKAGKKENANVITFASIANVMQQELPRAILSHGYSEMLENNYGIPRPITIYDRWAVAMNGLDLAQVFFDGTAINCTLLQDMPEEEKVIFDGISAMCRKALEQNYSTSKIAAINWLISQGIPLDETTFESESRY